MDVASGSLTQKQNREGSIDQQEILHSVALFLAAITARLLSRILGAADQSIVVVKVLKPNPPCLAGRWRWIIFSCKGKPRLGYHPDSYQNVLMQDLTLTSGADSGLREFFRERCNFLTRAF